MQLYEWGEQVTVVSCDMREWQAPQMADIMVSELLGSFSDNELSPECLDGVQQHLKGNCAVLCVLLLFWGVTSDRLTLEIQVGLL